MIKLCLLDGATDTFLKIFFLYEKWKYFLLFFKYFQSIQENFECSLENLEKILRELQKNYKLFNKYFWNLEIWKHLPILFSNCKVVLNFMEKILTT